MPPMLIHDAHAARALVLPPRLPHAGVLPLGLRALEADAATDGLSRASSASSASPSQPRAESACLRLRERARKKKRSRSTALSCSVRHQTIRFALKQCFSSRRFMFAAARGSLKRPLWQITNTAFDQCRLTASPRRSNTGASTRTLS